MDRDLKETGRNLTRNRAQPKTDEVSKMTAISGPTPDNREIQAMTTMSVRIKRMEIETMTEIGRVCVSIEHKEGSRTIGEMPMPKLTEVMHHDVMDLQEGAMSPRGIEMKVATETMALKTRKMQNLGTGGTKRGEVFAGQSETGVEVGE